MRWLIHDQGTATGGGRSAVEWEASVAIADGGSASMIDVVWLGVAFGLGVLARLVGLPMVGFLLAGFVLSGLGRSGGECCRRYRISASRCCCSPSG